MPGRRNADRMHGTDGKDGWHRPVNATVVARGSATQSNSLHGNARKGQERADLPYDERGLVLQGQIRNNKKQKALGSTGRCLAPVPLWVCLIRPFLPLPCVSVQAVVVVVAVRSFSARLRVLCGSSSCSFHPGGRGGLHRAGSERW
jgi:hypothetical protein